MNPLFYTDLYKQFHREAYPEGTLEEGYELYKKAKESSAPIRERVEALVKQLKSLADDAEAVGLEIKNFASVYDIVDACGWNSSSIGC